LKWAEDKEAKFRQKAAQQLREIDGLSSLLKDLKKKNIIIGAVTNAPKLNVEMIMEELKIREFFEFIVYGDECRFPKPHPEPYLTGLAKSNVIVSTRQPSTNGPAIQKSECVIFEDSPSGCRAGRSSGIYTIGIRSGHDDASLKQNGADVTFVDYNEVMSALPELFQDMTQNLSSFELLDKYMNCDSNLRAAQVKKKEHEMQSWILSLFKDRIKG